MSTNRQRRSLHRTMAIHSSLLACCWFLVVAVIAGGLVQQSMNHQTVYSAIGAARGEWKERDARVNRRLDLIEERLDILTVESDAKAVEHLRNRRGDL